MPKYKITTADGVDWEVESTDPETASKDLAAHRQSIANERLTTEAEEAPEWAKPFMAARDVATVGADTLTGGFGTKAVKGMFGGEPEMDVAARRNRMGWAAPALDVGLIARFLPTMVPKAVAKMGGGPAARWLTGTTAAGLEGATVGGLEAAGHQYEAPGGATVGPSVGGGILTGILGGAAGQQLGAAANKVSNLITGVNAVPQGIRSKLPVLPEGQKNPSAADKINVTANTAESKAMLKNDPLVEQELYKQGFQPLLHKDRKSFTPEQQAAMTRVVKDEPATKLTRGVGDLLGDKLAIGGAGITAGIGTNPVIGALIAAGMYGGSRGLKEVSAGGTREAVNDLRRLLAKKTRTEGPLSLLNQGRLTKGVRQIGLEDYLYGE